MQHAVLAMSTRNDIQIPFLKLSEKQYYTAGVYPRGRSLGKITMIFQILLANFKFQLNLIQISYFQGLLYFKFRGKFHKSLARLTLS